MNGTKLTTSISAPKFHMLHEIFLSFGVSVVIPSSILIQLADANAPTNVFEGGCSHQNAGPSWRRTTRPPTNLNTVLSIAVATVVSTSAMRTTRVPT
mmetsp:Transcript_13600/g.18837  ORF Transcript_13600/g.18837 Transcript_13600/m.18837 type:complete len:97 (-) Transcript_13600:282-572(-)